MVLADNAANESRAGTANGDRRPESFKSTGSSLLARRPVQVMSRD